jgi:hypothetical protein
VIQLNEHRLEVLQRDSQTRFMPFGAIPLDNTLIDPLLRRKRMHFGELGAVASAQMSLLLAEGKLDTAES